MRSPLVSIIIPAYNVEQYVDEAVTSALRQTYKNVEVVVVDDGSTDNTPNVLASYRQRKVIVYLKQNNTGLAGARNKGVKSAHGKYIAFLDADDIFLPEKVEEQVKVLEAHPDYGVCYSDLLHFTDSTPRTFYHHRYRYPSGDIFVPLLTRQFLNPLTVLARKEVFEKYGYFDETMRRSEDWEMWLRWAHQGVRFYYLDKVFAHYRMRSVGSLSSLESEPMMKEKNLEFFLRLEKSLTPEEKERYNFPALIARLRTKLAFAYLLVGKKELALAQLPRWSFVYLAVRVLPASLWKFGVKRFLEFKHRALLQRV